MMRASFVVTLLVVRIASAEAVSDPPAGTPATDPPPVVTLACGGPPCHDTPPKTPFDWPTCADYHLNTALIESAARGDRSAIELLRQRHRSTVPYAERHRIAAALLGRAEDDSAYWNELAGHARNAIRFPFVDHAPTQELIEWCAARGLDPDDYRSMTIDALALAASDPRARPLLLEALESPDLRIVEHAMMGLIEHFDDDVLPAIEKALPRFGEDAEERAMWLSVFRSDAADRVALKFISEERTGEYRELRRRADCETMGSCDP